MNNPKNKHAGRPRTLPFFVEFVKFSAGFAAIIAIALFVLRAAG